MHSRVIDWFVRVWCLVCDPRLFQGQMGNASPLRDEFIDTPGRGDAFPRG